MKLKDLATLPKVRDSYSYLYVEHCRIEQDAKAIAVIDIEGRTPVPCANLTTLLIGPGSTITHSAVQTLADNGCLVMWSGEGAVRFYALGLGETRSSKRLLRQAYLSSLPTLRLRVVRRMYEMRFDETVPEDLTLQQLRGREGVRVRTAYSQASSATGIPWSGRSFNKNNWSDTDPVNRALSCANSCLYGVCHAAIVSAGYSPALGFIHTGRMLSFVYDIADLYKADITIPLAFEIVNQSENDIESRTRHYLRDKFHDTRFLSRLIPDIERALDINTDGAEVAVEDFEDFAPGGLWNGRDTTVTGGVNYADLPESTKTSGIPTAASKSAVSERSKVLKIETQRANEVKKILQSVAEKKAKEVEIIKSDVPHQDRVTNRGETPDATVIKKTSTDDVSDDSTELPWSDGGQVF